MTTRKGKGKTIKVAPKGASLLTAQKLDQSDDEQKANNADLEQPAFEGMDSPSLPALERKFRKMQELQDQAKNITKDAKGLEEECLIILNDHDLAATGYKRGKVFIFIERGKPHVKGNTE